MARPYFANSLQPNGEIEFKEIKPGLYRAFFTPPAEALLHMSEDPAEYKAPVFEIDSIQKLLTVRPFHVRGMHLMASKYNKLSTITIDFKEYYETYTPTADNIEDFLGLVLPTVFVEDYNYGLGFKQNYKPIVSMLENFEIETLHLTKNGLTTIDLKAKRATIILADLTKMIKNIDSITQKAQRVSFKLKRDSTHEIFFELLNNSKYEPDPKADNTNLAKLMGVSTKFMEDGATKKEQIEAIDVITKNRKKIISEQPEQLLKLRNDIELVTLEELISEFELMLSKNFPEAHWQKLFDQNLFILNMAFGVPIVKVQGQASVGGIKLSGKGNKIADFLVKNSITGNAAIVEIKTPATKLINTGKYRDCVFGPSIELTAAINQVLDQIFKFQKEINNLKVESREYDLQSYSVQGILIAGHSMSFPGEQQSFELFRGNSKSVQIITFDELLAKLKGLRDFLAPNQSSAEKPQAIEAIIDNDELPF
ncbi:Shedu immune nuclease family protein [Agriterribacter sp.]|uniref:Shedu immune nuclease family protein n=1 Tax=Agriterribacter sp. TaxID=2821509 RepID=UPI002C0B6AEA|nr:Shedu immune nuclease family protein [Agriterribacter sp.]HTN05700.1 Shedu immune nuclease family protein [Agriterribacter sp.]